ncbi:MAG: aldehyde dehydrogenase family protein, partial [Deltaproteobacteria bacterium]|nr:aldehyde dehydrogenase family protein [Deltaproteobacteria bacterium]
MSEHKKNLIDGKWVEGEGGELEVRSPYDGTLVGTVTLCTDKQFEGAITSSHRAFLSFKKMPSYKRAELLRSLMRVMESRSEEFARTISMEAGKPINDARREVARSINTVLIASEEATRITGELLPLDVMAGAEGRSGIVRRFPVGVVLGIAPFNFPLNLVCHKVAPAIAAGCPIIIKPASATPLTSILLGEAACEAGWPPGLLNIVVSKGSVAGEATKDERVRKVSFTGSAAVGWNLKREIPEKGVTLELGGNAGVIVDKDTELEFAASRCVLGAFAFAGQVCISVQRIYAHEDIFDEFSKLLKEKTEALISGDPKDEKTQIGPMIDKGSIEATLNMIAEAKKGGATLLTGGKVEGNILLPTILTGTVPKMDVCREEAFAPIVVLEKFKDFKDAVATVNDSNFGLQAGVFSNDINNVFYAYENIEAGGIIAGDVPTFRVDNMPYGGVKQSGFG